MPIKTPHGVGRCGRPAVDYIVPPENVYPDFAVLYKGERRMYLCASCWDEMHDRSRQSVSSIKAADIALGTVTGAKNLFQVPRFEKVITGSSSAKRRPTSTLMRSRSLDCETAISQQLSLATEAVWRLQQG